MKNLIYVSFVFIFSLLLGGCGKDSSSDSTPKVKLEVTTKAVTNITAFSADAGGKVEGTESIVDRGFCWSTSDSPTLSNDFISDIDPVKGEYSLTMSILDPGKTYYVAAYAKTKGGDVVYGKSVSFTTKSVEQKAESNSYLATPSDVVVIPVTRANKSRLGNQIGANDAITAELIWMDNVGVIESVFTFGKGESGSLVVLAGTTEGNAVVSVKVNNKIVWSWHIWVSKDAKSIGTITMPSGSKLMDRNLGATSKVIAEIEAVGMQYQFGRKDPFTASSSFGAPGERSLFDLKGGAPTIGSAEGPKNLKYVTENPHTFVKSKWVDWADEDFSDWWNNENGSKTVYDPCPEGWQVPTLDDYTGLADAHFNKNIDGGHLFIYDGQSNYFPFTGYREVENSMDATANFGTFWVNASLNPSSAYSPSYGVGGTAAINGAPRGRAVCIRCLKK